MTGRVARAGFHAKLPTMAQHGRAGPPLMLARPRIPYLKSSAKSYKPF